MRSLNISNLDKRGFTLIEIVIAMAIMTSLMALGVFMTIDVLHASYSRSERDMIVSLLGKARSRAMANINESPWGMCYVAPNYVIFQGSACDPSSSGAELTPAAPDVSIVGLTQANPVVFTALSATTTLTTVTVSQQNKTSDITINYEGTIIW